MSAPATSEPKCIQDGTFSHQLVLGLDRLRQSQEFTDVTLKVDEVLLPCHCVVLSAASPYFRAMFTSDAVSPTVQIKIIKSETLQTIIDYVYSGQVSLTKQNAPNLIQGSEEFQLEELKTVCENYMMPGCVRDAAFSRQLMLGLNHLRQGQQFTDVTLKTDKVLLPCHRVVLSAASPYFRAMFTSDFKEAVSPTVEMKTMNGDTLKVIVDYIYTSKVSLTKETVQVLVQASDELQLEQMKNICEKYLLEQVDSGNCISLLKFAKLFRLKQVQDRVRKVILTQFKSVMKTEDFQELTEEELVDYISDSDLDLPDEDAVFEALTLWVNGDPGEGDRHGAFERLVVHVRLPFCTSQYLSSVVKDHRLVSGSPSCQQYIEEAQEFQTLHPNQRHEMWSQRTEPRKSFGGHRKLVLICDSFYKRRKDNRGIWHFKEQTGKWRFLQELPNPCDSAAICTSGSDIFIIGDGDGESWVCNPFKKDCYDERPHIGHCRYGHTAVVHNDHVYLIGGREIFQSNPTDRVVRFDSRLHRLDAKWTDVARMKKRLAYTMAVSHGDIIFVLGGNGDRNIASTTTQQFDAVRGDWSLKAEMPVECHSGGAAVINKRIYVVGGYNRTCISYDPASDVWTVLTPPREDHGFASVVTWRGTILVGGGCVGNSEHKAKAGLEDMDSSEWSYPADIYLINKCLLGIEDSDSDDEDTEWTKELNATAVVEQYVPATDSWSYRNPPLETEMWHHVMLNMAAT